MEHRGLLLPAQAFVKARGDGLGFDLSKAEFHFDADSSTASVWIGGQPQPRCSRNHLFRVSQP